MQEEGTSAGLDGEVGMSRTARTADDAERAKQTADEFTPVTYNYAFFHFIFAVASMYLAMLMTGQPLQLPRILEMSSTALPAIDFL